MSTPHSYVGRDQISYTGHLVVDEKGGMRLTRAAPSLDRGERAVQVKLNIPRSIFKTPSLAVNIDISDPDGPAILAEAVSEAASAIRGRGIEVHVAD